MTAPILALLVGLALLTIWGAIAPRGQWRVLASWTRRNPYADEPGMISVGIHRLVAVLATGALVFGGYTLYRQYETSLPEPVVVTPLEQMWGLPEPVVLNRIFDNATVAPPDLVSAPILRYEPVAGVRRTPPYIFAVPDWKLPPNKFGGVVGSLPSPGLAALDDSSLVVQVKGDVNCIPRSVVVIESEKTVAVGVYYGRPDGSPSAIGDCRPIVPDKDAVSLLVPIALHDVLGARKVTSLDGTAIPIVTDLVD